MYRLIESGTNNLTGGEVSILPAGKMDPKNSLLLQNLVIGKDSKLHKAFGYKPVHSNKINDGLNSGIESAYKGRKIHFASGKGRIYRLGENTLMQAYKSDSPETSTRKIHFAQMGDKVVAVNGDDVITYFQNDSFHVKTDWDLLANFLPDKPCVFKNRVWYINTKNKMEAMHSALQDPIKIEGYIDFSGVLPQADELIDIKVFLDFICFIFRNHILVYAGNTPSGEDSDFYLYQMISLPGILSGETNLNVGNYLFLATKNGIKNLQIIYPSTRISIGDFSEAIDTEVIRLIDDNKDEQYYTCGYWAKENLYFWVFENVAIVFNGTYKAFSRLVFPSEQSQWSGCFSDVAGNLNVLAGGYMHRYGNDYLFNGEEPLCIWKTGWLPLHPYGATCFPKFADIMFGGSIAGGSVVVQGKVYNGDQVSQPYAVGDDGVEYDTPVLESTMDTKQNYPWEEDFYMDSDFPIPLRVPLMNCGKFISITVAEKKPVRGLEFSGITVYSERRSK